MRTTISRLFLSIGLVVTAGVAVAGISPASAAKASREEIRVLMVDACVESEWRYASRRATAAKRCKCAAAKASKGLKPDQLATSSWGGGLTWGQSSAWKAALKTCK